MGGKRGKPRHKYAHLFADYFERTLLPESDPMYLEPRQVKRQLEMPEGTYYKYKKEYEDRHGNTPTIIKQTDNGTALEKAPVMPNSWDEYYRQYIDVIQSNLVYVNKSMDLYTEGMDLVNRIKRLVGNTSIYAAETLRHYGTKLDLMNRSISEHLVNNKKGGV